MINYKLDINNIEQLCLVVIKTNQVIKNRATFTIEGVYSLDSSIKNIDNKTNQHIMMDVKADDSNITFIIIVSLVILN